MTTVLYRFQILGYFLNSAIDIFTIFRGCHGLNLHVKESNCGHALGVYRMGLNYYVEYRESQC